VTGSGSPKEFLVVGVSHRTGTAALRDRLFLDEGGQRTLLADLRHSGIEHAIVLSTCDRTEISGVSESPSVVADRIVELLARLGRCDAAKIMAQGYRMTGRAAIRQLFAVASALDSAVIGEPYVLGQLKECHRLAAAMGMVGPELEALLAAAYGAAKRVRGETSIAQRPVSIAAVVVQMARRVHGELERCTALLLGGGEMGEMMIEQLRQGGLESTMVVHASPGRAELLAHRVSGRVRSMAELPAALAAADIVVAAVGGSRETIDSAAIEAALRARRRRPILCIDSAIPGDIDRAVGRIDGAYLFDLGDLERLVMEGRSARDAASEAAWAIVDAEVAAFLRNQAGREAAHSVASLRRHFEALRERVLSENPEVDAATATRLLINRLLHSPSTALRDLAAQAAVDGDGELMAIERGLARLFGLSAARTDDPAKPATDSTETSA
jgi:glutamyl-tRNA reductase